MDVSSLQTSEHVASDLAPGAHVVTPRAAYLHHGIYVGNGYIVHYAGFSRGLRNAPVEKVTVDEFTHGQALRILCDASPHFSGAEVVARALSRIGEDRYHLLKNNCEHFCEWCLRAEPRSYQVERLLSLPSRGMKQLNELIFRLLERVTRVMSVHAWE